MTAQATGDVGRSGFPCRREGDASAFLQSFLQSTQGVPSPHPRLKILGWGPRRVFGVLPPNQVSGDVDAIARLRPRSDGGSRDWVLWGLLNADLGMQWGWR